MMHFQPIEDQSPEPLASPPALQPAAIQPIYPHNRQCHGASPTASVRQHLRPHSLQPTISNDQSSHNNPTATTATITTTTTVTTPVKPISSEHHAVHRLTPYLCDPMEEQMRKNNVLFQEAVNWARILDGFSFMVSTTGGNGDSEDDPSGSFSSPPLQPPIQRMSSRQWSGTNPAERDNPAHTGDGNPRAPALLGRDYWFCGVNTQWARQRGPTIGAMIHTTREHGWKAAVEKIGIAFLIALVPGVGILICLVLTIVKVYIPLSQLHIQECQRSMLRRTFVRGLLIDLLIGLIAPIGSFIRVYYLYGISTNLAMARVARQGLITHADDCTRTFNHRAAANSPSATAFASPNISASSSAAHPSGAGSLAPFLPSSNVWPTAPHQPPLSRAQILARNKQFRQEPGMPTAIPIPEPRRNDFNWEAVEGGGSFRESFLDTAALTPSFDNLPPPSPGEEHKRQEQIQTHRSMEQKVLGAWEQHHLQQLEQQRHEERRKMRMSSLSLESSYTLAAAEASAVANEEHDSEEEEEGEEDDEGDQEGEQLREVDDQYHTPNNIDSAEINGGSQMWRVKRTPHPVALPKYRAPKSPVLAAAVAAIISQNSSTKFGYHQDDEIEEEGDDDEEDEDWELAKDDIEDDDESDRFYESGSFLSAPPREDPSTLLLTTPHPLFTTTGADAGPSQRSGELDSSISRVLASREFFGHTPPAFMSITRTRPTARMVDPGAYRPTTAYVPTRGPTSIVNTSTYSSSSNPSQTARQFSVPHSQQQQMHPIYRSQSILFPSPHFRNSDVAFHGSVVHQEPVQKEELERSL